MPIVSSEVHEGPQSFSIALILDTSHTMNLDAHDRARLIKLLAMSVVRWKHDEGERGRSEFSLQRRLSLIHGCQCMCTMSRRFTLV